MPFAINEGALTSVIAPITPFYGSATEWLSIEEGQMTTLSDIYRLQPGVRSVVDFIAGHLGRMPINLFQTDDDGDGDSDRTQLKKHPLQRLLNVPNGHRRIGKSTFWTDAWRDFLIYDRLCLVKIKNLDTGDPIALVRIPPVWFTPFGENYWHPEKIRLVGNRRITDFDIEDCIYIHGYDPVDPRIGVSPMLTLKAILEEEAAGAAWRRRFWEQGVQASMVVTRPLDAPDWDDDARDRFIESLRAAANRGKPLLLEEGMTSNPAATFDPKSAQYIQTKEFTRGEVLRVYNLPEGLFEQASSPNLAQYRAMLYTETLAPLLTRFVDELETQLLSDFVDDPFEGGYTLEPAIEEKLKGNLTEQISMLLAATGAPFMTRKESREWIGLKTLDDPTLDHVVLAATMTGNKAAADPALPPAVPGGGAPGAGDGTPPALKNPDSARNGNAQGAPRGLPERTDRRPSQSAGTHGTPDTKALLPSGRDKAIRADWVKKVQSPLHAFAKRQAASVGSGAGAGASFNSERWDAELKDDLLRERKRVAGYYGAKTSDSLGHDFDTGLIDNYLEDGAAAHAKGLNASLKQWLETAGEAAAAGALLKFLTGNMDQAAEDTVDHMKAFATVEAVKQAAPEGATKTWNTVGPNPRTSHEAMDGETVGIDDTFSNGLAYPHDPTGSPDETAGCTCELSISADEKDSDEAA